VKMLEELITVQHTVNKKLSEHIQNNEAVDALYRHVEAQSAEIKTMQDNQEAQKKQIEKLGEALLSRRSRPNSSRVRPNSGRPSSSTGRISSRPSSSRLSTSRPSSSSRMKLLSSSKDGSEALSSGQERSLDVLLTDDAPDKDNATHEVIDDTLISGESVRVASRRSSANSVKHVRSNSTVEDTTPMVMVHGDSSRDGISDVLSGKRKRGRPKKSATASTEHDPKKSATASTEHDPDGAATTADEADHLDSSILGSHSEEYSATDEFDDELELERADSHDESYGSGDDFAAVSSVEFHQAISDTKRMILNLRKEYSAKTGELETSVNTFKRIAFIVDDVKQTNDNLKTKVDLLSGANMAFEYYDKKELAINSSIVRLKAYWNRVHVELLYAMDVLEKHRQTKDAVDEDLDETEQLQTVQDDEFLAKVSQLMWFLDKNLEDYLYSRETLPLTFQKLRPLLESLFNKSTEILLLDDKVKADLEMKPSTPILLKGSKKSKQHAVVKSKQSFDTLLCSDQTHSLRSLVLTAMNATIPLLDEMVPLYFTEQEVKTMNQSLKLKAEAAKLQTIEQELRLLNNNKIDTKDFHDKLGKLATGAELAKLHSFVLENISRNNYAYQGNGGNNKVESEGNAPTTVDLKGSPEYASLLTRFEVLSHQIAKVQINCESFVLREEVHDALKAVVEELRQLKKSTVNYTLFTESLKTKADVIEVERVIKTIANAVGDLNITENLSNAAAAAAIHAKCLICDKPVITNRPKTAAVGKSRDANAVVVSSSTPLLGYSKMMDHTDQRGNDPDGMFNRLTSKNDKVNRNERLRISADLNILRTTIDPLPDIHDPLSESPRGSNNAAHAVGGSYKQRIRSSAGGGVGPTCKLDTR